MGEIPHGSSLAFDYDQRPKLAAGVASVSVKRESVVAALVWTQFPYSSIAKQITSLTDRPIARKKHENRIG